MRVQDPKSKVQTRRDRGSRPSHLQIAFTILEVMVACTIFFMVAFAILELVTRSLAAAKAIQRREPDPGIILAMYSTNRAGENRQISGTYEDIAPGMYPGYRWEYFEAPVGTNDFLWEVKVLSYNERQPALAPAVASTLFFWPNTKPGTASGGVF